MKRRLLIRFTLLMMFFVQGLAAMPSIECSELTERQKKIGALLSGGWVDNPFIDKAVFSQLMLTSFKGSPLLSDGYYFDYFVKSESYEVKRISENIYGRDERIIVLDRLDFWKRILYLEFLVDNKLLGSVLPIELSEVDLWWGSRNEVVCITE
ncbi:hypothetical protein Misp06_00255 [Microbulbifer sp. NBRC 101763]|uniref:hypothetical protein n=1 Tax=Microbulbifer sp. NBRC 101763 TaxID=1113820 RepID=UPI00309F863A